MRRPKGGPEPARPPLKARRYEYLPADFLYLEDLLDSSDESFFTATRYNPQHVLHQLLLPPKHTGYNPRSRGHSLTLSTYEKKLLTECYTVIYVNPNASSTELCLPCFYSWVSLFCVFVLCN